MVPGQEPLDVLAGELGRAADTGMSAGQVLGEDNEAVGAETDRVRPQRATEAGLAEPAAAQALVRGASGSTGA